MHLEVVLLAERLTSIVEGISEDVKSISLSVKEVNHSVLKMVRKKHSTSDLPPRLADDCNKETLSEKEAEKHPGFPHVLERLVVAVESLPYEVRNISQTLKDINGNITHLRRYEDATTLDMSSQSRDSNNDEDSPTERVDHLHIKKERNIVSAVESPTTSSQGEMNAAWENPYEETCSSQNSVHEEDDQESSKCSMRRDMDATGALTSPLFVSIKTERDFEESSEETIMEESFDATESTEESPSGPVLLPDVRGPESYAVPSCSRTDDIAGYEGAPGRHLSERYEEEQGVGVRQTDVREREAGKYISLRKGRWRVIECPTCKKQFPSKSKLITHTRVHTGERPYKCSQCEKAFFQKAHLSEHVIFHSSERPFQCDQCEKAFHKSSDLTRHIRIHTGERPFKCNQCKKSFIESSKLTAHMRIHINEGLHKCSQCDKAFFQRVDLAEHMLFHSSERHYKCSQCQKSFFHSAHLTEHMRCHSDNKPFQCDQCEKAFHKSSDLKRHIRIHTGERPYKCNQCKKSFQQSGKLTAHMRVHMGERPYKCSQCEKSFFQNAHLMEHLRFHSDERPYQCSYCEKAFCKSSDCTRHMRIHTGERPFKCKHCKKTFKESGHLSSHMRIHTASNAL